MKTESLWEGTAPRAAFAPLRGETQADVCIVGGGHHGHHGRAAPCRRRQDALSSWRHALSAAGTTGYSTGNLHVVPDDGLRLILRKWNREVATAVAQSRAEMLDHIERTVRRTA